MLEVANLSFDYPDRPLLQGIQFTANAGCLLHLRGSNGAGKTTLLKLLAGMLHPIEGCINYQGSSIHNDLPGFQQQLCYVGHKTGVSQLLTVRENCRFELQNSRSVLSFDVLIKTFALEGLEDTACGLLSVGQRRRVGLLRLLMSDASLWLLDEPFVALDNEAVALLLVTLERHLLGGGVVVLTSHQQVAISKGKYQEYHL